MWDKLVVFVGVAGGLVALYEFTSKQGDHPRRKWVGLFVFVCGVLFILQQGEAFWNRISGHHEPSSVETSALEPAVNEVVRPQSPLVRQPPVSECPSGVGVNDRKALLRSGERFELRLSYAKRSAAPVCTSGESPWVCVFTALGQGTCFSQRDACSNLNASDAAVSRNHMLVTTEDFTARRLNISIWSTQPDAFEVRRNLNALYGMPGLLAVRSDAGYDSVTAAALCDGLSLKIRSATSNSTPWQIAVFLSPA